MQNLIRTSIPNTVRNRELVKNARMRYIQTPNPVLGDQRSPNSDMDTQRLMQFQNLLSSPISRRSILTRSVAVNTSDSSSEEETDDEADDPAANNSNGATIFWYDNDTEDADSNTEKLEANELLDNLIWRFDE